MFRPCASAVKYRLTSRSRSSPLEVYAAAAFGASLSHTSNGFWCSTAVFLLGAEVPVPPMAAVDVVSSASLVRGVDVARMWAMFTPGEEDDGRGRGRDDEDVPFVLVHFFSFLVDEADSSGVGLELRGADGLGDDGHPSRCRIG